jgi:hypothetical protein
MSLDARYPGFLSHKLKAQRGEIDGFYAISRVLYKDDFKSWFAALDSTEARRDSATYFCFRDFAEEFAPRANGLSPIFQAGSDCDISEDETSLSTLLLYGGLRGIGFGMI